VMVLYSRDREQRVAVQLQQPIQAGDQTRVPAPAESDATNNPH
jgi:hypothetical protein